MTFEEAFIDELSKTAKKDDFDTTFERLEARSMKRWKPGTPAKMQPEEMAEMAKLMKSMGPRAFLQRSLSRMEQHAKAHPEAKSDFERSRKKVEKALGNIK